jgi:hypothetical protein
MQIGSRSCVRNANVNDSHARSCGKKNSCPFPESCRGQQAQVTRKHMSRGPGPGTNSPAATAVSCPTVAWHAETHVLARGNTENPDWTVYTIQHQRTVWNVLARRWTVCGRSVHGARAHVHTVRAMPSALLQHGPRSRASGQPTGVAGRCLEAHRRCVQEGQRRESACGCWQRGHGNAHHCERPDTRSS